jgi:hypothetical protein
VAEPGLSRRRICGVDSELISTRPSLQPIAAQRTPAVKPSFPWLPVAAAVAFVLIQFALYPPTIAIKDESTYLSVAYVLRAGTVFADLANIPIWSGVVHNGHVIAMYPPGQSLLLLPTIVFNWHLVFAVILILHVVGFFLFMDLLKLFNVRREWAVLYLFFPALVLFSRTVMTEIPSATLMLLALLLYFRGGRQRIAAGLVFGALSFLAYKNLIPFAVLILTALVRDIMAARPWRPALHLRRRWHDWYSLSLLAGFLPVFGILVAYNLWVFGRILGYGSQGFGLQYLIPNLAFYAIDLMALLPLMLLAPVVYRGPWRLEVLALTVGVLIATSAWYYIDNAHGLAENALTGARLLLPVMPVWLLSYAAVLDRILKPAVRFKVALAGAATVGALLCLVVSVAHERHLQEAANVQRIIYAQTDPSDLLVIDDETAKFISPAWGSRQYVLLGRSIAWSSLASRQTVAIVYTTQGGIDASVFPGAQALANELRARLMVNERVGAWRLTIWRLVTAGTAETLPTTS